MKGVELPSRSGVKQTACNCRQWPGMATDRREDKNCPWLLLPLLANEEESPAKQTESHRSSREDDDIGRFKTAATNCNTGSF